ncbi:MAG: hypothetical protein LBD30_07060, partial [Verrucomicrobiales bacterium]|nr:hypothetical protein [Verrucomicrobiales bacterium]
MILGIVSATHLRYIARVKIILTLCAAISLLTAARAQEQLHVQFSQKRSLYLQYEPIDLTVVLTNTTDAPITLATSAEGKPWLSFLIFVRDTNSIISPISPISLDPVTIPPGATRPVTVNILPHYSIRDTGGYTPQAVISIPGLPPIMTGKLYFTIGKGETLWKKNIY